MIETVGIVGLGLIGGSMAKGAAFKAGKTVYGFDISKAVMGRSFSDHVLGKTLTRENMRECDVVFVCLYPKAIVEFIRENIPFFKKGGIVSDVCGVKGYISQNVKELCRENGLAYIGTHPMAGKEVGGYENSEATLFEGASVIIAGGEEEKQAEEMKQLFLDMGFGRVMLTDEKTHDEIIALTSQLAHIISSSYVKSGTARRFVGFSANSFEDMTRVAKLNPTMWTELFLANRIPLLKEIGGIIGRLTEYETVLKNEDPEGLFHLLSDGNKIKEELLIQAESRGDRPRPLNAGSFAP